MIKKITFLTVFLSLLAVFCGVYVCFAQSIKVLPEFSSSDRVMVLAPHPDDEAIGAGGVLQKAVKAGAKVKVVCFTNGDANQLAFMVYEKRLTFRKGEFFHMGQVRKRETISAMRSLGIAPSDIIFLGYPDFGTMAILLRYWNLEKPYRSILAKMTKVTYPGSLSLNAPYVGSSVLHDLKKVIGDFKPTKIFVSHPADTNGDHRALYVFLRVALWDLNYADGKPAIFPYIIHVPKWPTPRGYRPQRSLVPPKGYCGIDWYEAFLTPKEVEAKKNAISFYRSQIEYLPWYLVTFARKNELFGDYQPVKLKDDDSEDILWHDVDVVDVSSDASDAISSLAYAQREFDLWVKITLKKKFSKKTGVVITLLGYKKNEDFVRMPKMRLSIGFFGLKVKDKDKAVSREGIYFAFAGKTIIVKVPLVRLGLPEKILSCAKASGFSFGETAWRILEVDA